MCSKFAIVFQQYGRVTGCKSNITDELYGMQQIVTSVHPEIFGGTARTYNESNCARKWRLPQPREHSFLAFRLAGKCDHICGFHVREQRAYECMCFNIYHFGSFYTNTAPQNRTIMRYYNLHTLTHHRLQNFRTVMCVTVNLQMVGISTLYIYILERELRHCVSRVTTVTER